MHPGFLSLSSFTFSNAFALEQRFALCTRLFGKSLFYLCYALFSKEVVPMVVAKNEHVLGFDIKRVEECIPIAFQQGLFPVGCSPVFLLHYVSS